MAGWIRTPFFMGYDAVSMILEFRRFGEIVNLSSRI